MCSYTHSSIIYMSSDPASNFEKLPNEVTFNACRGLCALVSVKAFFPELDC